MRRFRYGLDPLCLSACGLYAFNRWFGKGQLHSGFIQGQFNDLLLIPAALPWVMWLQRLMGLRDHDAFPQGREIALHLVLWSVLFEVVGPHLLPVVGDPWDAVVYALGSLAAWGTWRWQASRLQRDAPAPGAASDAAFRGVLEDPSTSGAP